MRADTGLSPEMDNSASIWKVSPCGSLIFTCLNARVVDAISASPILGAASQKMSTMSKMEATNPKKERPPHFKDGSQQLPFQQHPQQLKNLRKMEALAISIARKAVCKQLNSDQPTPTLRASEAPVMRFMQAIPHAQERNLTTNNLFHCNRCCIVLYVAYAGRRSLSKALEPWLE